MAEPPAARFHLVRNVFNNVNGIPPAPANNNKHIRTNDPSIRSLLYCLYLPGPGHFAGIKNVVCLSVVVRRLRLHTQQIPAHVLGFKYSLFTRARVHINAHSLTTVYAQILLHKLFGLNQSRLCRDALAAPYLAFIMRNK